MTVAEQMRATESPVALCFRLTYQTLRWLMVALALLLLFVTVATAALTSNWPTSISAYYAGPVRDVFVGVLFAVAACLVAYRGSTPIEDYGLNGAGFYAVIVALVPTNLIDIKNSLSSVDASDRKVSVTNYADYITFLRVSILAVILLAAVLAYREYLIARRIKRETGENWISTPKSLIFVVLSIILLVAFLALTFSQAFFHDAKDVTMQGIQVSIGSTTVPFRIHDLAAILLIASLAVSVWSHAWPDKPVDWQASMRIPSRTTDEYKGIYLVIFVLMTVVALVGGWYLAAVAKSDYTILILEWWEILLFILFWALETRRGQKEFRSEQRSAPREPEARGAVGTKEAMSG